MAVFSPVFSCFFANTRKPVARVRMRERATKNPVRHAAQAPDVVSVNTHGFAVSYRNEERKSAQPSACGPPDEAANNREEQGKNRKRAQPVLAARLFAADVRRVQHGDN